MVWDDYFLSVCSAVAGKSPCLSRKIGAILVRDKSIISTGYNGPPRGVTHCGRERINKDENLASLLHNEVIDKDLFDQFCPRRLLGIPSAHGLSLCPAAHAEANCIVNAARVGASTIGSTLYLNTVIPCSECLKLIINAGVIEVVCLDRTPYNKESIYLIKESKIKIREFGKEI